MGRIEGLQGLILGTRKKLEDLSHVDQLEYP